MKIVARVAPGPPSGGCRRPLWLCGFSVGRHGRVGRLVRRASRPRPVRAEWGTCVLGEGAEGAVEGGMESVAAPCARLCRPACAFRGGVVPVALPPADSPALPKTRCTPPPSRGGGSLVRARTGPNGQVRCGPPRPRGVCAVGVTRPQRRAHPLAVGGQCQQARRWRLAVAVGIGWRWRRGGRASGNRRGGSPPPRCTTSANLPSGGGAGGTTAAPCPRPATGARHTRDRPRRQCRGVRGDGQELPPPLRPPPFPRIYSSPRAVSRGRFPPPSHAAAGRVYSLPRIARRGRCALRGDVDRGVFGRRQHWPLQKGDGALDEERKDVG